MHMAIVGFEVDIRAVSGGDGAMSVSRVHLPHYRTGKSTLPLQQRTCPLAVVTAERCCYEFWKRHSLRTINTKKQIYCDPVK